jgi:phosphoglycerol transferase MdoB-like AlkP superfamily enzyme
LSINSHQEVASFDVGSPFRTYNYAQYPLQEKPNIYLIFMESYGSVLYTKTHFQEPYLEFLRAFEDQIAIAGWETASTLSESPTWGGGTWISYTNVMFGLPVKEQSQYVALQAAYQQLPYPNMGRYFHTQDYKYVWVAPIQRRLSGERDAVDRNFFGVDRWITLETMDYHGPLYGWGPSPPDQYTFGFIGDFIRTQEQPTFLVFLTQNTHYPWTPLPAWVENWRTFPPLDSGEGPLNELEKPHVFRESRQNYLNAVEYTFKSLGDFIASLDDPNAVIVLIGDHQPPAVSYKGDGYATMVHIISQDEAFLESFQSYGFTPGLILEDPEVSITHQGFYSLFIRSLVASYGRYPGNLPPYLPEGLIDTQP